MHCTKRPPQCVGMNEVCGGPGQQTRSCCGAAACVRLLGGSEMRCQSSNANLALQFAQVVGSSMSNEVDNAWRSSHNPNNTNSGNDSFVGPAGATNQTLAAGCPGCRQCSDEGKSCDVLPCCGSMTCSNLLGGSGKVCTSPPTHCIGGGAVCGGPGQLSQSCCGDMQCLKLLGGDRMTCVERHDCVQEGSTCGGPGRLTLNCCGGLTCQTLLGSAEKQCVKHRV